MGDDSRETGPSDPSRAPLEVLYVGPDRGAARAVAEALGASGAFTVRTRTAPDAALAVLETQPVDVVVAAADDSDTGLDFCRAVRTAAPTIPLVLVVESDSERLVRAALSAGVDGYFATDEGYDALAARLQAVVAEHRTMQASLSSHLAVDALSDGTVLGGVVAPDGTVQQLTEAVERATGVDVEQSLGEPLWTLPWWSTDEQTSDVEGHVAQAATGDAVQFQGSLECDDETRTVSWTLLPIQSGPAVDAILLTGTDITQLVRHSEQLERQNRRLEEFSSVVSHDLRSPLSVAGGHLELASRACDSDHLDHAEMALSRMERLIGDLRTMARQGQAVGDLTDVSLSTAVRNAWASVEAGDARLVVDGDLTIRCDETRLWQLFENLFRNSVEHGSTSPHSQAREDSVEHGSMGSRSETGDSVEHGSTSSRATPDDAITPDTSDTGTAAADSTSEDDPLTVRVGPLETEDGFFVEDTGIGIPPDERGTVFEMGYSSTQDGTGFGLAIVEEIVRAHQWEIVVTAGSEGGARFEIAGVETVANPD